MSYEQILGGIIAVIVAGMPAMVALLKIKELHLAVNGRMDKFIEGMVDQNKQREIVALKETDRRVAAIEQSRDRLVTQNTQLINHFAELMKQIDQLPSSVQEQNAQLLDQLAEIVKRVDQLSCSVHRSDSVTTEGNPPCTV